MENLLEAERDKPDRMGGRAGASVRGAGCVDRVRDVVHEVWARDVDTIPARREYDIHENAFVALLHWKRVGHWVGRLHIRHAKVADGLVRESRAQRTSGV